MPVPPLSARAILVALLAWCAVSVAAPAGAAKADADSPAAGTEPAPGVGYRSWGVTGSHGPARVHLVTVDLRDPGVRVDLLTPGTVGARAPLSALADARAAVAAVNGDFFDISGPGHPGVEPTGASVGPAVGGGRHVKAAVPEGQRFGSALPPGTGTREVLGVGVDRRGRLGRLTLDGSVTASGGTLFPLEGLNQYALPVDSVGVFTADWGAASRVRATCGTDQDRAAACSRDTYEVTVRAGRVAAVARVPGAGVIPRGTEVLVGRERGARSLRGLTVGDRVSVRHRLVAEGSPIPYHFAVGGYPVLRAGPRCPVWTGSPPPCAPRPAWPTAGGRCC